MIVEQRKLRLVADIQEAKYNVLVKASIDDVVIVDGKRTLIVPENIDIIGSNACEYLNVEQVLLPNGLKRIEREAFAYSGLVSINIPESVQHIAERTFLGNSKLKQVQLPNNLSVISKQSFYACKRLDQINMPSNLEVIEDEAFNETAIKSVTIPGTVKSVGDGAFAKSKTEHINIESRETQFHSRAFYECVLDDITIDNNKFTLANIDRKEKHLWEHVADYDKLSKLEALSQKLSKNKQHIQHAFAVELVDSGKDDEFAEGYFKIYNNAYKAFFGEDNVKAGVVAVFQKLCFNLGVFSHDRDVANKAAEFLKQAMVDNKITPRNLVGIFHQMDVKGYNEEFNEFFCKKKNLDELIYMADAQEGFIAKIYNNFEEVQRYNVSRNSQHRQLKPTIQVFERYFAENTFMGVTDETRHIADELAKFPPITQKDFELATKIHTEYKDMVKNTGYEDKAIVEEDVFERINYYSGQIELNLVDTARMLDELLSKEYTYEWLAKNDPRQFTVGFYCSCCATIQGAGQGIVRATQLLPNVHTLAIKNKRGDIRAKSTLYVNEQQGYGVLNNVEVSLVYANEPAEKEKIYTKFKLGVEKFVEEYNKTHEIPLHTVTIGINRNDLFEFIEHNPTPSEMLKAIDYDKYGVDKFYKGDWYQGQRVIYSSDKESLWTK